MKTTYVVIRNCIEGIEDLLWLTDDRAEAISKREEFAMAEVAEKVECAKSSIEEHEASLRRTDAEILDSLTKHSWSWTVPEGETPGPEHVAKERSTIESLLKEDRDQLEVLQLRPREAPKYGGANSSMPPIFDYYCVMAWDGSSFRCVCEELGL